MLFFVSCVPPDGIVEEVELQISVAGGIGLFVPVRTVDRELHELRAERRAADAVYNDRLELPAGFAGDLTGPDLFGKRFDRGEKLALRIHLAVREMGDLAFLVRILDFTGFDAPHFAGGAFEFRLKGIELRRREFHAGEVDGELTLRVDERIFDVPFDPIVHFFWPHGLVNGCYP